MQTAFFRQHNCVSKDAQQKYNSRAAQLYRDKLVQSARQAMKSYGTQVCYIINPCVLKIYLWNTCNKKNIL